MKNTTLLKPFLLILFALKLKSNTFSKDNMNSRPNGQIIIICNSFADSSLVQE